MTTGAQAHVATDTVGNALIAINKEMMRQNEIRLAYSNVAVDFDGVGTMPERMDRMFLAIATGLEKLDLKPSMAALGAFPILDRSDTVRRALLFHSNLDEKDPARYGRRYAFPLEAQMQSQATDDEILNTFVEQLRDVLKGKGTSSRDEFDVIAAPYFVRPWSGSSSQFEVEDQVFSKFSYCGSSLAPTWPWLAEVSAQPFVQRLVLLLLIPKRPINRAAFERHAPVLDAGFRYALGAFLSSAGVNADENTILFAQRVAAQSVLRAHEIANLTRFLLQQQNTLDEMMSEGASDSETALVIQSFRKRFEWLLEVINRLQDTGSDANLETLNWRQIIESWSQDRRWQAGPNGQLVHSEIRGAELRLNFTEVESNIYLSFVPVYFDRLLDILQRNTFDAWQINENGNNNKWQGPKIIEINTRQKNGSYVVLTYRSTGPEIDPEKIQRLFREVIEDLINRESPEARASGVWALHSVRMDYPIR